MTVKEVIDIYRKSKTLPRKCHLNWLKENFNPILYDIDKSLNINWGCQTCARNYLSMISRYLEDLEIKQAEQDEEAKPKILRRLLRVDEVGLYEITLINDKVIKIKDINGCKVKNNEVLLDYVETNSKAK